MKENHVAYYFYFRSLNCHTEHTETVKICSNIWNMTSPQNETIHDGCTVSLTCYIFGYEGLCFCVLLMFVQQKQVVTSDSTCWNKNNRLFWNDVCSRSHSVVVDHAHKLIVELRWICSSPYIKFCANLLNLVLVVSPIVELT